MAKLSITVLGERVLVKPLDAESTSGGIYLPEAAQEKPQRGEIIAIGTAQTVDADEGAEFDAKVGDVVVFAKYGGTELTVEGEDYLVMDFDQILAKEQ